MTTPRSRTSDAPVELRASVLDAALTLGIRNSMVAKWMFDPIQESEDGDEFSPNPGLSSPSPSESTASHSTTDDSSMAPFHFRFPGRFGAPLPGLKLEKIHEQPTVIDPNKQALEAISVDHFSLPPVSQSTDDGHSISSLTKGRNKLRKVQSDYESDKGYMSESGKKSKDGTKRKNKGFGAAYESDGGYLSDVISSKKSKKSKNKPKKAIKDTDGMSPTSDPEAFLASVNATFNVPIVQSEGYVTDSATTTTSSKRGRTKTKKEKGHRTRPASPLPVTGNPLPTTVVPDTPSKKNRLLRMMTRSASRDREKDRDKTKLADELAPPPVPPLPVSLPIAEKFARSGPFAASNAASPPSSGVYAGASSVTSEWSRSTSADIMSSSGEDETKPTTPPFVTDDTSHMPEVWNGDSLVPGNAKVARAPLPIIDTGRENRDNESPAHPIIKADSRDLDIPLPLERTKSPTPLRSLSPVFSSPFNALLSTPERRRKKKQNANSPSGSVSSTTTASSSNSTGSMRYPLKLSTSAISQPNPHLAQRLRPPPSPLELASRMRSDSPAQLAQFGLPPSPAKLSPGYVRPMLSPSEATRTPDSYVFVEKELDQGAESKLAERQSTFSVIPSSDYIIPSPLPSPLPPAIAERRSMNVAPLLPVRPLDVSSNGDRSNTPVPVSPGATQDGLSVPNTPTARASVIAYYQIPPPSPPPTGPLPRVPDDNDGPRRGREDSQFLSPAAARYGSRSPSPLRMTSRPTSPSGLFSQAIPPVRRGRESPFPTRPILPAEDRGMLVRRPSATPQTIRPNAPLGVTRAVSPDPREARMQRFRDAYATPYQDDSAEGENLPNDAYSSSEDFHEDTRSSTYIRQARARGEKRVYFSDQTTSTSEEDIDVQMAIHALRKNVSFQEEEYDDDFSRYAREDEDGSYDRHSIASMSVYSRYSMLDADRSAALREGFIKRVEALYGTDDIPAVPEIPATLRAAAPGMSIRNASSPSRF